jgi:hypothetical protein
MWRKRPESAFIAICVHRHLRSTPVFRAHSSNLPDVATFRAGFGHDGMMNILL